METGNDLVQSMARDLGMLAAHLRPIIRTAPLRYKMFHIPKRSGGQREVAQPAREVKLIQRWILQRLASILPVHETATAYQKGCSIRDNAQRHAHNAYMLKLDFKNFFQSILADDIVRHLQAWLASELDVTAMQIIARACTWAPRRMPPLRLCVGAPSSPLLSNSIMFAFDQAVFARASDDDVTYSRYADDLTFSSGRSDVLQAYVPFIATTLKDLEYPSVSLNSEKTVFCSRAGRRRITGITITPTGSLSIGRDRKRLIRAMFDRDQRGRLNSSEKAKLSGLLSFADSVEPGFSERLRERRKR